VTPKEKALNLIDRFENYSFMDIDKRISAFSSAKKCALIAVDEIINANPTGEYGDPFIGNHTYDNKDYWIAVKQEIEKL
jgi:hypothetical protein